MSKKTTTTRTTEYDDQGRITKVTEVVVEESESWTLGGVPLKFAQGGYVRPTGTTLRS